MLIFITGAPGTGKTTLARQLYDMLGSAPAAVVHSDAFIDRDWEGQVTGLETELTIQEADGATCIIVEGTTVARLLDRGYEPDMVFYCVRNGEVQPAHRGMNTWITKFVRAFQRRFPERVFVRVMPAA